MAWQAAVTGWASDVTDGQPGISVEVGTQPVAERPGDPDLASRVAFVCFFFVIWASAKIIV